MSLFNYYLTDGENEINPCAPMEKGKIIDMCINKSMKSPINLSSSQMNYGITPDNCRYENFTKIIGRSLSGRVLDSRPKGRGFEPQRRHCLVSLSKNINPSLVLVQPRKTRPYITERLLMGRKESNQTNKS